MHLTKGTVDLWLPLAMINFRSFASLRMTVIFFMCMKILGAVKITTYS